MRSARHPLTTRQTSSNWMKNRSVLCLARASTVLIFDGKTAAKYHTAKDAIMPKASQQHGV